MIQLGHRAVGPGAPVLVVAEAGVNHNGDPGLAEQLVEAAAAAGADAVKFQTFRTGALVTRTAQRASYQVRNTGDASSQYDMLERLELHRAAHLRLKAMAEARGMIFLSTPFDPGSLDFLVQEVGVVALKLGSGEVTNLPLVAQAGRSGRPTILSTGMSTLAEVEEAVRAFRSGGGNQLALLQCVTNYPAEPDEANLRAMATLREHFGLPVGYSDHCTGNTVAVAAVALGACIVEKHFTLDQSLPGPDHAASATPAQLAALVREIRIVERALGSGVKAPTAAEQAVMAVARKSLVAARNLPAGTILTAEMLIAKRPGTGISPAHLDRVLGRRMREAAAADTVLTWDLLEGDGDG